MEIPEIPEPTDPRHIMVCFQIVTAGGAVVDTEPEEWADLKSATARAHEWSELRGRSLQFITFEGDGAVVKTEAIEHVAVMKASKMRDIYLEAIADQASKEGSKDE